MLKKDIVFEDFDGIRRTETHYFNLTQTELMEMATELPDGITDAVGNNPEKVDETAALRLMETLGGKGILDFIKKLVLKSYGIRHDGTRFEKSEKLSTEFSQTLAFDALIVEFMTNDKAANDFINAVIPKTAAYKIEALSNKPAGPALVPSNQ